GIRSPTEIVAHGDGIAGDVDALRRLQALIERQPGVAGVFGPGTVPFRPVISAFLADDGNAARYVAVFDSPPLGVRGIQTLGLLRNRMPTLLTKARLHGATAGLAGDSALASETIDQTVGDLG